jgi:hypothetical protein
MRPGRIGRLLQAAALMGLTCCRAHKEFAENYDPGVLAISFDQAPVFLSAPIVVAGRVVSVSPVGGPRPANRAPDQLIQLTKATIHVENVLRGRVPTGSASFYYYGFSDQNAGYSGPPTFRTAVGDRRIFFLTFERGDLRSVGDVRDYTLAVVLGSHEGMKIGGATLGEQIAELLFSPGASFAPDDLEPNLAILCPLTDRIASRANTVRLLRALLRDERLRASVCLYLAKGYEGQYACLESLRDDATQDAKVRAEADRLWRFQRTRSIALAEAVAKYPLDALSSIPIPSGAQQVKQELQLLLDDPEPKMRSAAMSALRRNFFDFRSHAGSSLSGPR